MLGGRHIEIKYEERGPGGARVSQPYIVAVNDQTIAFSGYLTTHELFYSTVCCCWFISDAGASLIWVTERCGCGEGQRVPNSARMVASILVSGLI